VTEPAADRAADALRRLAGDRFDQGAWRVLFDVLWPYVFSVCARLHGDDLAAAQDSAQESLIRLARYAPFNELPNLEAVRAYLRRVCRRVVRSHCASPSMKVTIPIDDEALIASDAFDPEEQASASQLFDAILRNLDEPDRELLRMVRAGFSLEDIAGVGV